MIILDTDVVSEGLKARPDMLVQVWVDSHDSRILHLCAPVMAEIRYGAGLLPPGTKQDILQAAADRLENDLYENRILPFDTRAASVYGRIVAARQRIGKPIGPVDGMIAAIAISHGASVATRDTYGFSDIGLSIINPFHPT